MKVTVSTDTDVLLDPEADPGDGVLYMRSGNSTLYVGDGLNETDIQVTGLSVAAGTTLRFPTNVSESMSNVYIPKAVIIDGTVSTIGESVDSLLESYSYVQVGKTGTVTSSGRTAGAPAGVCYILSYGVAINKGTIECNGATGGGSAAMAGLVADSFVYNTGVIRADGGDNAEGAGGSGGLAGAGSYFASVYTSGTISANGGNGSGGAGGTAGMLEVVGAPSEIHRIVAGGIIQANGGNGSSGNGNNGEILFINSNQVPCF